MALQKLNIIAVIFLILLCHSSSSVNIHWEGESLIASSENSSLQEVIFRPPPDYGQEDPWLEHQKVPYATHLVWLQLDLKSNNLSILTMGVYGRTSLHAANRFMKLSAAKSRGYTNSSILCVDKGSFMVTAGPVTYKQKFIADNSSWYEGENNYAAGLVFMRNDVASTQFEVVTTEEGATRLATNNSLIIVGRVVSGMKHVNNIAAAECLSDGTPVKPILISASGMLQLMRPFQLSYVSNSGSKRL